MTEPGARSGGRWWGTARGDVVAGLTTAVFLVPQGLAYATIAGMPPVAGLYTAAVAPALYALLASSRAVSLGPVALDSLLVASAVGAVLAGTEATPGSPVWVEHVVLITALVGGLQLLLGVARAGWIARWLTAPVIGGFTAAAALLIAATQVVPALGLPVGTGSDLPSLLAALPATHPLTAGLTVASVAVLFGVRAVDRRVPGALVVAWIGGVAAYAVGLDALGVALVGAMPSGLPAPTLPVGEGALARVPGLLPGAAVVAVVGYLETLSIASPYAERDGYAVDGNREWLALGLANAGSAVFGGFVASAGFSRTAVHHGAGAVSRWGNAVAAGTLALALTVLGPAFSWLPRAALAAIVIVAVSGLLKPREVWAMARAHPRDGVVWALTFVGCLAWSIPGGLALGVVASAISRRLGPPPPR